MNKTFKTVLITLAVTLVILFAVVMIFGEDTSTPTGSSSDTQKSASAESQEILANTSPNSEKNVPAEIGRAPADNNAPESPAAEISKELLQTTLAYDIFDWNMADEQGKAAIAKDIIHIWNAGGNIYEMTAEDLIAGINNGLHDQANIFEVACVAAQIDPLPYFNAIS
ncbi:hypothetical protein V6615_14005 [Oscillospiraceae bacterium PP1C4]